MTESAIMREVTETEIKKRLAFDNPWWDEGEVDARFRDWPRRAYFDGFVGLVTEIDVQRAVVLMGPRRVGKTVMIQQTIQRLLDDRVPAANVLYVSVDTPVYTGRCLGDLLRLFQEVHEHGRKAELYVFFDEIQYHGNWEVHLKSLVDSFPSIRFVVSGSAAAALKLKSDESGAGRFTDFVLPPLTFAEFLRFRGIEDDLFDRNQDPKDIDSLNAAFIDYLNFGGFPEAVMAERIREKMDRHMAGDIVDRVLLRDLPSLHGVTDTRELNRLFMTLAYNTGREINIDDLARSSRVAKNTLKKYLEYLEAAFLIRRIYRVDGNARRFKRQSHFKVYLATPCLRAALFGAVGADDESMGRLAETAIVCQIAPSALFRDLSYARWKNGEVDLVMIDPATHQVWLAYQVIWSDRAAAHPESELRSLIDFCTRKNPRTAWVSTRTATGTRDMGNLAIHFHPAAYQSYFWAKHLLGDQLSRDRHPLTGPPPTGT